MSREIFIKSEISLPVHGNDPENDTAMADSEEEQTLYTGSWRKLTYRQPARSTNLFYGEAAPDIANTLFRAGYIESWGRGTIKMINECQKHHLPAPRYYFDLSGFVAEFFTYTEIYLKEQGLREELIKIILYVQAQGRINNSAVQQLCKVSKATATRYHSELEREKYLHKTGITRARTGYTL